MIGDLRMLSIKPGREREFEQLFARMREEMRGREPGCRVYTLLRSRLHPGSYIIHEQYEDPAAVAAHQTSALVDRYVQAMRDMQSHIDVEYFDVVAG